MTLKKKVNRRQFLRGMMAGGLVTLQLPMLELFMSRKALAQDGGFPRRFGLFYWGNGNRPEHWVPTGEGFGDDWALSQSLQSLAPVKDKLAVITGMSLKVPNTSPHWSGGLGFLTGQELIGDDDNWTAAVPSFDQVLAQGIGGETVYRSLITGCVTNDSVSWNGPNARNPVESDPYLFYEKIFGPTFRAPGEEGIVDPSLGFRRSVLDVVREDTLALQSQLGSADRIRLEQHLDGIRDIEMRLARLQEDPPSLEACYRPEAPLEEYPDIESRPQMAARNAVMSQMIAMALACDQTRVVSYAFTSPLNNILYDFTDMGHHSLTHNEPGDQPLVQKVTEFTMEQASVFLQALDAIPEGDGTLLDNCAVVISSEVSEGRAHSLDEYPLLLAGSAGGRLHQNLHYRSHSIGNANQFTLSVLRAMGLNLVSFGHGDSEVTDGLSALEV